MADVRRLMELGMPGPLAKEVAAQIDAAVADAISNLAISAADVSFDPDGVPGVTGTNVQDAIDDLANVVDGL